VQTLLIHVEPYDVRLGRLGGSSRHFPLCIYIDIIILLSYRSYHGTTQTVQNQTKRSCLVSESSIQSVFTAAPVLQSLSFLFALVVNSGLETLFALVDRPPSPNNNDVEHGLRQQQHCQRVHGLTVQQQLRN
jgi:hypothetical protein